MPEGCGSSSVRPTPPSGLPAISDSSASSVHSAAARVCLYRVKSLFRASQVYETAEQAVLLRVCGRVEGWDGG
jgi:hypothetical protein